MEHGDIQDRLARAGHLPTEGSAPTQCNMMDLSGKGLESLPEDILQMASLQHLYLEGNAISELSEDFFHQLPNLVWLDLRNNKLKSLPCSIGDHRCLKTLLLEGNLIRRLPVELGNLTSLKALNLRKCPIEFPPEVIMHQGLMAIQAFLREPIRAKAEHASLSAHDTGFATTLQQEAQLIIDDYRKKVDRGLLPRKAVSEVWKKMNVSKMPLIEKLQLNVRTGSSLSFSDEKERQRFKTLKQKLMQEEKKDDSSQTKKVWGAGFLSSISNIPREKTPNLNILFPELTAYDMTIQTKRKRELRLAAMKEHKEKQAFIEQRMKDQRALREWREQAKLMQEQKEIEIKQRSATERNKIVKSAPYATDPNYYQNVRGGDLKGPHTCEPTRRLHSRNEMEEGRAAKDQELRERIQQHIKLLRERRKRQKGNPQEELEAAKADLEIATELKSTLARRKIVGNLS